MASADYDSAVLADTPLAFYHLNEASGLVAADPRATAQERWSQRHRRCLLRGCGAIPDTGSASAVSLTSGTVTPPCSPARTPPRFGLSLPSAWRSAFLQHGDPAGDGWAIGIAPNNAPRGGKRKLLFQSHGVSVNSKISLASGVWSMVSVSWDAASVSSPKRRGQLQDDQHAPAGSSPVPPPIPRLRLARGWSGRHLVCRSGHLPRRADQGSTHRPLRGDPAADGPLPARAFAAVRGARGRHPDADAWRLSTTTNLKKPRMATLRRRRRLHSDRRRNRHHLHPGDSRRRLLGPGRRRPQPTPTVRSAASPTPPTRSSLCYPPVARQSPHAQSTPTSHPASHLPDRSQNASARLGSLPPGAAAARLGTVRVTLKLNALKRRATLRAKRGTIRSVTFKWDGRRVKPARNKPRTLIIRKAWIKPGKHTLKAIVRPRHGTRRTIKMRLTVTRC